MKYVFNTFTVSCMLQFLRKAFSNCFVLNAILNVCHSSHCSTQAVNLNTSSFKLFCVGYST